MKLLTRSTSKRIKVPRSLGGTQVELGGMQVEKSNVITLPVSGSEKSERRLSVEASQPKIEKLSQAGRYYVTPARRVHVRIPSMLHVRVSPNGVKSWAISVRIMNPRTGKRGTRRDITLGRFPAMPLADAIERGHRLWAQADEGIDPRAGHAHYQAASAVVPCVGDLLDTFAEHAAQRSAAEMARSIRSGLPHILPTSAALIGREDVVPVLKRIGRDGKRPTVVRLRSYIASFLKWVEQEHEYGLEEWVAGYKPSAPKGKRARYLTLEEARRVLVASEELSSYWRNLVHILMLTGLRRDEAAEAQWSEIDWASAEWTIPAERMKGKVAHTVPLTPEMVEILQAQKAWQKAADPVKHPTLRKTRYIFTSTGAAPVSGFSKMMGRLRRLAKLDENWTLHDFRRTLVTCMTEDMDMDADLGDRILAHKRGGIEGVYNKATRLNTRREMHERWAAEVLCART